jgi:hypothetical protein
MSDVRNIIDFANAAQPSEFKDAVHAALADKIQNSLLIKKLELGANLFSDKEQEHDSDADEFSTSAEENVDENL